MSAPVNALAQGAVAGVVATAAHTAVMLLADRVGALGEPPPQKITRAALDRVAPRAGRSGATLALATSVAHVGFGAAMGAAFALMNRRSPSVASGVLFGTMVWAAAYIGWVPALHIMPKPSRDRPGRPTAMIAAHWAFGASLALMLQRLRGR